MLVNTTTLAALAAVAAVTAANKDWRHGHNPDYGCGHENGKYINFTSVPGYFLQDDPTTNSSTFNYSTTNFGLINRTYPADSSYGYYPFKRLSQWQRFYRQVESLNRWAPRGEEYKVLFLGRHGEGFHNAAESFYGTPAWNCYWAELDGNSTAKWNDAHLTNNGIAQAGIARNTWARLRKQQHIHTPDAFFTSPLYRCLDTARLTFSSLEHLQPEFLPTIKEYLREGISIHTCDQRSNKSYIHEHFPSYRFERGFSFHDELWNGVTSESSSSQDVRSRKALDDIFARTEGKLVVSITSHSGEIGSLLRVLGHQPFSLSTGAVITVLVKAKKLSPKKAPKPSTTLPWTASPHCTKPPVTSISGGACVCPNSASPVTTPLVPTTPP